MRFQDRRRMDSPGFPRSFQGATNSGDIRAISISCSWVSGCLLVTTVKGVIGEHYARPSLEVFSFYEGCYSRHAAAPNTSLPLYNLPTTTRLSKSLTSDTKLNPVVFKISPFMASMGKIPSQLCVLAASSFSHQRVRAFIDSSG